MVVPEACAPAVTYQVPIPRANEVMLAVMFAPVANVPVWPVIDFISPMHPAGTAVPDVSP